MIEKTNKIKLPNLKTLKIIPSKWSIVQKCIIPSEFMQETEIGQIVLSSFVDNRKTVINRIFPSENYHPQDYCEIDCCVEVINTEKQEIKENYLTEIEVMTNVIIFKKVSLDVTLNDFNKNLMSNNKLFEEYVKNVLKFFVFKQNCSIDVSQLADSNFCVEKFFVKKTDSDEDEIGKINEKTIVEIIKIYKNSSITYQPLGGLCKMYQELADCFECRENNVPNQILLIGPSGSGKTSLLNNLIIEKRCKLFPIRSSDVLKQYPGETEEILRNIFIKVKDFSLVEKNCLPVIFIKDIEQFCPKESKSEEKSHISRISAQLITLLDQISSKNNILVVATTSQIELLDLNLRRPGRLEREIYISVPSALQRNNILEVILNQTVGKNKEIVEYLSARTHGFVGADLSLLIQHAVRKIVRNKQTDVNTDDLKVIFNDVLKTVKPSSLRSNIGTQNLDNFSMSKIGGMLSLKKTLEVSILAPLKRPESFLRFGLQPPKGILLYGPPGCAKTTIAKCLAAETHMTFLSVSGAEIYSPYVGDAERFLVKLFHQARISSPVIIFLDEIDALVGSRSTKGERRSEVQTRVLSTLLTEMDGIGIKVESSGGISSDNSIIVIAATNRPDMIDEALMRPGRFDKLIHVPAPDEPSRLDILKIFTKNIPLEEDVDLNSVAEKTNNFSGADLFNVCNEAALNALTIDRETTLVKNSDFQTVLLNLKPSLTEKQIKWYKDFEMKHKLV